MKFHVIDYVVAPYEADAQMAHLAHSRKVDAVLTEDSDLLVFGCHRVLYKLLPSGYVQEIKLDNYGKRCFQKSQNLSATSFLF
jgi:exonuclease 1